MIFVTVGAQMPFDRMVKVVDAWAHREGVCDVVAQIGSSAWRPRHIRWTASLEPARYRRLLEEADVVIAHAGMGSILTAMELGKPIIVMPRHAHLGETRNDHQVATMERFAELGRVVPAADEEELSQRLEEIETRPCRLAANQSHAAGACHACCWHSYHPRGVHVRRQEASPILTAAIRSFIAGVPVHLLQAPPEPEPEPEPVEVAAAVA